MQGVQKRKCQKCTPEQGTSITRSKKYIHRLAQVIECVTMFTVTWATVSAERLMIEHNKVFQVLKKVAIFCQEQQLLQKQALSALVMIAVEGVFKMSMDIAMVFMWISLSVHPPSLSCF